MLCLHLHSRSLWRSKLMKLGSQITHMIILKLVFLDVFHILAHIDNDNICTAYCCKQGSHVGRRPAWVPCPRTSESLCQYLGTPVTHLRLYTRWEAVFRNQLAVWSSTLKGMLPDLANKNIGLPVKLEFQINNKPFSGINKIGRASCRERV